MADVRAIPRKRAATRPKLVHQFLVVLAGTAPLVWRRIQVPERYSFWDLHVAIQDAMGWLDYHIYPRCVAGEGRCPPEDCGGVHGYSEFLEIIADADHEEHESTLRWAGGSFDPEAFDPAAVKFDDPRKRWKKAFGRPAMMEQ